MQIVGPTWLSLVTWTCGSWSEGQHDIFHGPVILAYILKTIWCMNILIWDCESVWPYVWPQNKCSSLWPIFHAPVFFYLVSWRLFDVWTSLFGIVNQYDPTFDLKINVGHCDLYFMVQWLLPYILKTIWCMNILISNCESVWPDVSPQNKYRSWWPIFHGPVIFALYLEDYLMYEHPYLGLWISMTRCFTSK